MDIYIFKLTSSSVTIRFYLVLLPYLHDKDCGGTELVRHGVSNRFVKHLHFELWNLRRPGQVAEHQPKP